MRQVKLFIATSLDGYIASPDGSFDWLFHDADYGYDKFMDTIDTVVMGRKTYETSLDFEEFPYEGLDTYVFSRAPAVERDAHATYIKDPAAFIKELTAKKGKDIWLVGGGEIATLFLEHGLVDQVVMSIHPLVLGGGIPLFRAMPKTVKLQFESAKPYPSGLLQVTYSLPK